MPFLPPGPGVALRMAAQVRAEYAIAGPATEAVLLTAAEAAGAEVVRSQGLRARGLYVPQARLIILRHDASPWVLAHELFHCLATPDGEGAVWLYPENAPREWIEEEAETFARLLCGE